MRNSRRTTKPTDDDFACAMRFIETNQVVMDSEEVCRRLAIIPSHLSTIVRDGRLRYYVLGKTRKFLPEDVAAFMAASRAKSNQDEDHGRGDERNLTADLSY